MKIIKDVDNKLLSRREVVATIENSGATLTREDIKKAIAKQLKVKEELVIINHAGSYFGDSNIKVEAKIYEDEKSLKINARPHMIKRNTKVEVKAEGEE